MICRRAVVLAAVLAGCGGGADDERRFDPFTEVKDRNAERPERASPRWERIATLTGSGDARKPFTVTRGAIQWRARWQCDTGRLALAVGSARLTDGPCPGEGDATAVDAGPQTLEVRASGRWKVSLEQQVDTALREPPLADMRSGRARVVARGRFYGIERRGRGTALLYRLPSGRLALRFDGFSTSPNDDLFVWLSTAARPRTTVQAARARHTVLRELKSTLGEQNYVLPRGVAARDVRSIVIWCVPVRIAYTAAAMRAN